MSVSSGEHCMSGPFLYLRPQSDPRHHGGPIPWSRCGAYCSNQAAIWSGEGTGRHWWCRQGPQSELCNEVYPIILLNLIDIRVMSFSCAHMVSSLSNVLFFLLPLWLFRCIKKLFRKWPQVSRLGDSSVKESVSLPLKEKSLATQNSCRILSGTHQYLWPYLQSTSCLLSITRTCSDDNHYYPILGRVSNRGSVSLCYDMTPCKLVAAFIFRL